VRQSPAGKNVSMEAEDIVGIRHQATIGEEIANWEDFVCAVVTVFFGVCKLSATVVVICSYVLLAFNKSDYQPEPRL
jgi:hypothetical protein